VYDTFDLPNFDGGWLVGSVVVESAVIWLLTGFGVRGAQRKKNTKSASMAMCYVTYVVLSV